MLALNMCQRSHGGVEGLDAGDVRLVSLFCRKRVVQLDQSLHRFIRVDDWFW